MIPANQVGIQRRIDDSVRVGNDDPNHIQFGSATQKLYMETDGSLYPKSHYEFELSEDTHRYFSDRDITFNKKKGALGEMPDYLKPKHDALVELGLLQEAMSRYPYIATVPGGFIRQNLFELAQEDLDKPEILVVNGKQYQIQRQLKSQQLAQELAQTPIDSSESSQKVMGKKI